MKMMGEVLIAILIIGILLYILFSFAMWDVNPANWGGARVAYSISLAIVMIALFAAAHDELNKKD